MIVAAIAVVAAVAAHTPAAGSAERAAILDAVRPGVEAKLGTPVRFVVTTLRVVDGWAIVVAEPERAGGGAIDGAARFGARWADMDGLTVSAVVRMQSGRWTLVGSRIGATDIWYCGIGPAAFRRETGC